MEDHERDARIIKGRIEKACLEDVGSRSPSAFIQDHSTTPVIQPHQIISDIENVCSRDKNYVSIRLDQLTISKLHLELTINGIVTVLLKAMLKIILQRYPRDGRYNKNLCARDKEED